MCLKSMSSSLLLHYSFDHVIELKDDEELL
jgi:hypothetical protein